MKLDVVLLLSMLVSCSSCDKRETSPAPPSASQPLLRGAGSATVSAPTIGAASSASASAETPPPPKDAGPDEWYSCTKNEDCVLAFEGRCCPTSCDPVGFDGYTAVSAKYKAQFVAHEKCAEVKCPTCPPPFLGNPRNDANFFPLCKSKRCVAVNLRESPYSQCKTTRDCKMRFGIGCCEGCGDKDLVVYNPASTLEADTCPVKPVEASLPKD